MKLTLAILASATAMFAVLILLDLYQIFVTPLSPLGINHWIPEALFVFLFGRYVRAFFDNTQLSTSADP